VVGRIEAYGKWLAASDDVPKLLVAFEPSSRTMMGADLVEWCLSNIAGLEVENGRRAYHLAPEDQPEAIATAIAGCETGPVPLSATGQDL
jgi:haloalkane dehalogenase